MSSFVFTLKASYTEKDQRERQSSRMPWFTPPAAAVARVEPRMEAALGSSVLAVHTAAWWPVQWQPLLVILTCDIF